MTSASDPTVIFVHIPKASGMTLNGIMQREYDPATIYSTKADRQKESLEEFKQLPVERRQAIRLLRGHFGYGLHPYIPRPYVYISMMRDPVDRVISHYYYIRKMLNQGFPFLTRPWLCEAEHMSLEEYARYGRSTDVRNGQTKMVSGFVEGWDTDVEAVYDSQAMLATAKQNVRERFAVVGATERFDESILLLKRALGWKIPLYIKTNITENRLRKDQVSPEAIAAIRESNDLDLELYQFALGLFEERIHELRPAFTTELRTFRLLNALYGEWYRLRSAFRYRLKRLSKGTPQART